ncbi:MAG: cobalt-precorrin 5A hydrolase [Selenomonadaceae bacterium]|nr:cobalt-precorrin 5A hydrolase [Selenomonadaceae bacterium]
MRAAVFAVTDRGAELASTISNALDGSKIFVKGRDFDRLRSLVDNTFDKFDALIFIGAVGITVRMIAPHIVSKLSDPAVISVDERGRHVISLLSGHVGGANDLTRRIAAIINAEPIITTATDVEHLTAVDAFTSNLGLVPQPKDAIKFINRAVLEGRKIFVTDGVTKLELVPQRLIAGIGCRRGIDCSMIRTAVESACRSINQSIDRIDLIATVDVKSDEVGLLKFARELGREIKFFDVATLRSTIDRYMLDESAFVKQTLGVGNVCEAAALACVERGRFALTKTKFDGVTVALVWERP